MPAVEEVARRLQQRAESRASFYPIPLPAPQPKTDPALLRRAQWSRVIPSRFVHARLADFASDVPVHGPLSEWCEYTMGRNVVIVGPVGTGKTHAAAAAAFERHMRGDDVLLLPSVELLDRLRPKDDNSSSAAFSELCAIDLLVIDDLGAEKPSEWTAERLYALVNRRWMEERPTIVTTNMPPRALEESSGPRMYSRLVGNDAVTLRLAGDDRRRKPQ